MKKKENEVTFSDGEVEKPHNCPFTKKDVEAVKVASSLILRCRDAVGNVVLITIGVAAVLVFSAVVLVATGGKINLFKAIGIGN
jgi:hypothetical protein